MTQWANTGGTWSGFTTTSATTLIYPTVTSALPMPTIAAPKKQSALEWLDKAIEETCALART